MKEEIIKQFSHAEVDAPKETFKERRTNNEIEQDNQKLCRLCSDLPTNNCKWEYEKIDPHKKGFHSTSGKHWQPIKGHPQLYNTYVIKYMNFI